MIDATMTKRMEEATRLTRAGKLHEAMALLQGGMPEAKREEAADNADRDGNIFDGIWTVIDKESTVKKPASETPSSASDHASQMSMGGFSTGSFSNQVGSRDYKLYIPSGYHGQAMPLVVMLHGCTQSPDDFAAGTEMNRLAEKQLFCVLYPSQPMTANSSKCWNWFKAEDQQREGGEPAILAGMTRQIIDTYALDATRVYVAGLSAGAAMATTLAMTYPDLFAAVGVHSGLPHGVAKSLPDALGAMQGGTGPLGGGNKAKQAGWASDVPAIIFHGDRDTTVHPSNADRVAAQYSTSNQAGARVEQGKVPNGRSYTITTHQDAEGKSCLEQWRIHGAGHAWAGGSVKGSYTDPTGPNATEEMLRFFLQHQQATKQV
ncbi:extracellular catalytic domain type 1 short-chain-length polyhydroxyalkanoate depolymerase [Halomonas campaniensis]|nr:PHB depolymerase family esterase [Halomonas campaniensis]